MVHIAGGFAIIPDLLDIRSNLGGSGHDERGVGIAETGGCRASPDRASVPERPAGTQPAARDGAPMPPFRTVLHERRPRAAVAVESDLGSGAPSPAVFPGWGGPVAGGEGRGPPRAEGVAGSSPARILVSDGRASPEARIELRSGLLAGASIHVVTEPAGIRVHLAAPTEAARRVLTAAVDRARLLLGTRGIVVRPEGVVLSGATEGRARAEREGRA
jgi:hypothetical protein